MGLVGPIGIQDIRINFLSKCRRAVLTAAVFDIASGTYKLNQLQELYFTNTKSSEDCG